VVDTAFADEKAFVNIGVMREVDMFGVVRSDHHFDMEVVGDILPFGSTVFRCAGGRRNDFGKFAFG